MDIFQIFEAAPVATWRFVGEGGSSVVVRSDLISGFVLRLTKLGRDGRPATNVRHIQSYVQDVGVPLFGAFVDPGIVVSVTQPYDALRSLLANISSHLRPRSALDLDATDALLLLDASLPNAHTLEIKPKVSVSSLPPGDSRIPRSHCYVCTSLPLRAVALSCNVPFAMNTSPYSLPLGVGHAIATDADEPPVGLPPPPYAAVAAARPCIARVIAGPSRLALPQLVAALAAPTSNGPVDANLLGGGGAVRWLACPPPSAAGGNAGGTEGAPVLIGSVVCEPPSSARDAASAAHSPAASDATEALDPAAMRALRAFVTAIHAPATLVCPNSIPVRSRVRYAATPASLPAAATATATAGDGWQRLIGDAMAMVGPPPPQPAPPTSCHRQGGASAASAPQDRAGGAGRATADTATDAAPATGAMSQPVSLSRLLRARAMDYGRGVPHTAVAAAAATAKASGPGHVGTIACSAAAPCRWRCLAAGAAWGGPRGGDDCTIGGSEDDTCSDVDPSLPSLALRGTDGHGQALCGASAAMESVASGDSPAKHMPTAPSSTCEGSVPVVRRCRSCRAVNCGGVCHGDAHLWERRARAHHSPVGGGCCSGGGGPHGGDGRSDAAAVGGDSGASPPRAADRPSLPRGGAGTPADTHLPQPSAADAPCYTCLLAVTVGQGVMASVRDVSILLSAVPTAARSQPSPTHDVALYEALPSTMAKLLRVHAAKYASPCVEVDATGAVVGAAGTPSGSDAARSDTVRVHMRVIDFDYKSPNKIPGWGVRDAAAITVAQWVATGAPAATCHAVGGNRPVDQQAVSRSM